MLSVSSAAVRRRSDIKGVLEKARAAVGVGGPDVNSSGGSRVRPNTSPSSSAQDPQRHFVFRDGETKGVLDLRIVGAPRYAADPGTEVLCVAYAVDDGPVRIWRPGDPIPAEVTEAKRAPNWLVVAHGDPFETQIERDILGPRYGWPQIPIERHRCTMAMALAAGLPAKLGAVADALELARRKDAAGERIMHQMAKPRRLRQGEDPAGIYWWDDPERLARLYEYAVQDVEVLRELFMQLAPLPRSERAIRRLSCTINDRGFAVDRKFAEAARKIAQAAVPEIDAELAELTGGAVAKISQVARLLKWARDHGYAGHTLSKKAIERQFERGALPMLTRRVLELRLAGAQSAVKKIDALLARAGNDDRIRGAFRYHGASTGRWAGEGFQPQNLKRPAIEDLDAAIAAVASGDITRVKELHEPPLAIVGDCSRAMIIAAPEHELIGGDFSMVEARVLACLANEDAKLDVFRRFDRSGDLATHPYVIAAAKALHIAPARISKGSPEYQIGKIVELAFGYQGGLNAWRRFDPDRCTDDEVHAFKHEWRAAHPHIVQFWHDLDRAAWLAVRDPGRVVPCGVVAFKVVGSYLKLLLPSGRKLSYPFPRIIRDDYGSHVVFSDNSNGQFKDCRHGLGAYGGLWTENVVQAVARDLLAEAMLRIEAAGYPIVLHVHDEVVAEVPIGFGSTNEFTQLMTQVPSWATATGLPLAASAWRSERYAK